MRLLQNGTQAGMFRKSLMHRTCSEHKLFLLYFPLHDYFSVAYKRIVLNKQILFIRNHWRSTSQFYRLHFWVQVDIIKVGYISSIKTWKRWAGKKNLFFLTLVRGHKLETEDPIANVNHLLSMAVTVQCIFVMMILLNLNVRQLWWIVIDQCLVDLGCKKGLYM